MKIYVTGHKGFIGKNCIPYLRGKAEIGTPPTSIEEFGPDVLVHLAWKHVDQRMKDDPYQFNNIAEMLWILDRCKNVNVKRFVGLGSQAEITAQTRYAQAKRLARNEASAFCDENRIEFVWARLYSIYGPHDRSEKLIPRCINTLLQNKYLQLDSCNIVWDYLYVEDAVRALWHIATGQNIGNQYEIGSGKNVIIRDVVTEIARQLEREELVTFQEGLQERSLFCDPYELEVDFQWKPKVSLKEGIQKTIAFHKEKTHDG